MALLRVPTATALAMLLALHVVTSLAAASAVCPYPGWANHRLNVTDRLQHSLINASSPGLSYSLYGLEGGAVVEVGGTFYLFVAEFYAPPHFVPSRLALWATTDAAAAAAAAVPKPTAGTVSWHGVPLAWQRVRTLYNSTAHVDCGSLRASLGSNIQAVFDVPSDTWNLFYVGFKACNDSHFVNRLGRIFRAESVVRGRDGVAGPYVDRGVVLSPDGAQPWWEGLQGTDSLNPFQLPDGSWAGFYGSANTEAPQGSVLQQVGLAFAPHLHGPWTRAASGNPVHLAPKVEQPVVTRFADGTYGAVFDALGNEFQGMVGYAWSPDGKQWHPNCTQLLNVVDTDTRGWAVAARTPQGLVPHHSDPRAFHLFFSGYNATQPMELGNNQPQTGGLRFEAFGVAEVAFA